jgi:hypothetical protein
MPTPNYRFDKRQRELAKQKKKDEKRLKKEARKAATSPDGTPATPEASGNPSEPQT